MSVVFMVHASSSPTTRGCKDEMRRSKLPLTATVEPVSRHNSDVNPQSMVIVYTLFEVICIHLHLLCSSVTSFHELGSLKTSPSRNHRCQILSKRHSAEAAMEEAQLSLLIRPHKGNRQAGSNIAMLKRSAHCALLIRPHKGTRQLQHCHARKRSAHCAGTQRRGTTL